MFENLRIPTAIIEFGGLNTFHLINKAYCDLLGYSEDELLGMSVHDVTHPDERGQMFQNEAKLLSGEISEVLREKRYIAKDGRTIWGELSYSAITDERGEPVFALSQIRDLTEEHRARSRLLDAIESVPNGIALYDADDRLVICNEQYRRQNGLPEEKYEPGRKFEDVLRDIYSMGAVDLRGQTVEEAVQNRLQTHRVLTPVDFAKTSDGRWSQATEYRTSEGGTLVIRVDMTDQIAAEEALKQSQDRYRDFTESASDWHWETGPDLRFTFLSERIFEETGYPASHFLGKKRMDFPWADPKDEKWKRHLEDMEARRPFRDFEYAVPQEDGTTGYFRTSGVPVFDEDGAFLGYRGTACNITETESVKAAHEREVKFRQQLLETTQEGFWYIAPDGTTVDVNPAACRLLGGEREDVIGKSIFDFVDQTNADIFRRELEKRKTGDGGSYEIELTRLDGSKVACINTPTPVFDESGQHIGSVGLWTDLSKHKDLEEALRRSQKMEAVGQLSGGIAHDFNNLLGIILSNLEILRYRIPDDAFLLTRIDAAIDGVNRGAELTDSLLQFSRSESREPEVIDINAQIQQVENLIGRSLTEAIEVAVELQEDVWHAEVEPGNLLDSLINIVNNARDAMPHGGHLYIRSANTRLDADHIFLNREAEPGDYVQIEIADTGLGMDEETEGHVFEPFFSTKSGSRRSGLGMSMVFGFVQRSKGEIAIETKPYLGTKVRLYLPRSEKPLAQVAGLAEQDGDVPGGNESIMLVDDDEALLRVTGELLTGLGYAVTLVNNGNLAVDLLRDGWDGELVVSDVVMPGLINGFHLARIAGDENPSVKILLTSGFPNEKAIEESGVDLSDERSKRLMSNLLAKPYSLQQLAAGVRRTLDQA